MSFEPTNSSVRVRLSPKESLASLDARVWFLGCGLGCATGLSLLCALIAIWQKQTVSIAIPALLIALLHASIITVFWVYRFAMHRRNVAVLAAIEARQEQVLGMLAKWAKEADEQRRHEAMLAAQADEQRRHEAV